LSSCFGQLLERLVVKLSIDIFLFRVQLHRSVKSIRKPRQPSRAESVSGHFSLEAGAIPGAANDTTADPDNAKSYLIAAQGLGDRERASPMPPGRRPTSAIWPGRPSRLGARCWPEGTILPVEVNQALLSLLGIRFGDPRRTRFPTFQLSSHPAVPRSPPTFILTKGHYPEQPLWPEGLLGEHLISEIR
jgi:hypothetical protein